MEHTAGISKVRMASYGLMGFLIGFPGAVLAYAWLI
jgi:hypothetical protein